MPSCVNRASARCSARRQARPDGRRPSPACRLMGANQHAAQKNGLLGEHLLGIDATARQDASRRDVVATVLVGSATRRHVLCEIARRDGASRFLARPHAQRDRDSRHGEQRRQRSRSERHPELVPQHEAPRAVGRLGACASTNRRLGPSRQVRFIASMADSDCWLMASAFITTASRSLATPRPSCRSRDGFASLPGARGGWAAHRVHEMIAADSLAGEAPTVVGPLAAHQLVTTRRPPSRRQGRGERFAFHLLRAGVHHGRGRPSASSARCRPCPARRPR